jgi:hypothetical protein
MKGTGKPDPDRNQQFKHIGKMRKLYLSKGWAVISIDAKKKELIGDFKSNGSEYRASKSARKVNDHDFGEQRVTPYGVYDCGRNKGFINLGTSSDTAEFAVESIRRWWKSEGSSAYPGCKRVLILADNGGSNGSNRRMFKKYLSDLSKETGLIFYVCHYPSGTSKYNPIEHRLFSEISKSIQAQPLTDIKTFRNLISHTRTTTGLSVTCVIDDNVYKTGQTISRYDYNNLPFLPSSDISTLNYSIG